MQKGQVPGKYYSKDANWNVSTTVFSIKITETTDMHSGTPEFSKLLTNFNKPLDMPNTLYIIQ